jgi:hypothetical protein
VASTSTASTAAASALPCCSLNEPTITTAALPYRSNAARTEAGPSTGVAGRKP